MKLNETKKDIGQHGKGESDNYHEARERLKKRISPYNEQVPMEPWNDGLPEISGSLES